jgi:hypothetical protein
MIFTRCSTDSFTSLCLSLRTNHKLTPSSSELPSCIIRSMLNCFFSLSSYVIDFFNLDFNNENWGVIHSFQQWYYIYCKTDNNYFD